MSRHKWREGTRLGVVREKNHSVHREGHLEASESGISLSCWKRSREAKVCDGVDSDGEL